MKFYGFAGMTIVMKKQKPDDDVFSFAKVYSWRVFLAIFGIALLMGLLVFLFEKFSPYSSINSKSENVRRTQTDYGLERSFFFSFGSFTLSGDDNVMPYTNSTRVLLSGFWFFR